MRYEIVIFGGGATGTATFRDLAMRGFSVALIEKRAIASGTTSSSHQNLLGGMRYVLKDPVVALECANENVIISRIAPAVVGDVQNYFVGFASDYALSALREAKKLNILAKEADIEEVLKELPELNRNLNIAVETADKNINAQRFCWLNCHSAKQNGGNLFENSELQSIRKTQDEEYTITTSSGKFKTNYIINATGPWVNAVASKIGTAIPLTYSQGTIIIQKALCSRGIQYLREPSDADAYIVHDGFGWLGTTSTTIQRPEDAHPEPWADTYLKNEFARILPNVKHQPTLHTFTGVRALADGEHALAGGEHLSDGRLKSRDFKVIEDPNNMFHIIGGKLTTARLMAEKIADDVCQKAQCIVRCRTSKESLDAD
ncbi:MAG: FAD-dependent oxidoreductase [Halobacteriota archaeon]|jgi:glycerol-3-phosphate dehydrogenase